MPSNILWQLSSSSIKRSYCSFLSILFFAYSKYNILKKYFCKPTGYASSFTQEYKSADKPPIVVPAFFLYAADLGCGRELSHHVKFLCEVDSEYSINSF